MARKLKTMDGNTAAAHVSYAFTEVAAIYPITPSSVMAELTDEWSAAGRKNIFGQTVRIAEMQSEGGAAGAVHGSIAAGALTTTYTASQGLLLMIPNMYKISGECLPNVIHVSARALATHSLSIFGDHSDIYACRSTGYAMLASTNPQEVMDLGAVAHLATLSGKVPFVHFFDGFRTSHELKKIEVWDYEDLADMLDTEALERFRASSMNPAHPSLRGSAQNYDTYFQNREACNTLYNDLPAVVEAYMDKVNTKLGTDYKIFNYYGDPNAEYVIVAMGSVCDTIEETVDYLMAKGEKVGLIKVRLYRPFSIERFVNALPSTVKAIAVLDRTKDPAAIGEPLYVDVLAALNGAHYSHIKVAGGRYGLASKNTTPGDIIATFRNIQSENTKNPFTISIIDDVTNLSLPVTENPDTVPAGTISCKFWGLGSDGTVGANKNSIKIIGDHTDKFVQAYFQYDSKKSGGVTISHVRFGDIPIKSTYFISQADFVACHNQAYIEKFDIVQDIKPGGTFLLNCNWSPEDLETHLPAKVQKCIAERNIQFYTCNAVDLAREIGLGNKTNMILQAAFFKLSNVMPIDDAVKYMKDAVITSYGSKGEHIVSMNMAAIDAGLNAIVKIDVPEHWKTPTPHANIIPTLPGRPEVVNFVNNVLIPVNAQKGDDLPVSAFVNYIDGVIPQGTAIYEKRSIAVEVPSWIPENCIQCNRCSLVCPHAVIRPFVFSKEELANAPEGLVTTKLNGKGCEEYQYAILTSPFDCTGCGSCINVCPAKEKALVMKPLETQRAIHSCFVYADENLSEKQLPFAETTVKGSQFKKPLLEFSGACAGCGETPYAKLITQLFGERMYVANATGCSSIWGGSFPCTPYTVSKRGRGVTWGNSLFEDNAEYGYGMHLGASQRRDRAKELALQASSFTGSQTALNVAAAAKEWLENCDNRQLTIDAADKFTAALKTACEQCTCEHLPVIKELYALSDMFAAPSIWIFGGDGWATDIGFGGLDHVLASNENVNIFVFDTEVYSNTGGQASKSSQIGQMAQFAAAGKATKKKDLAEIAMSYGYVYVAQIALGADYQQTVKAISEAEAYDGPSLIIAYSPCINHGIRTGMANAMLETQRAVQAGYWHLFRYDPRRVAEGKNPFQLDSKEPTEDYLDFIKNEVRYSALQLKYPERATKLFKEAQEEAQRRYLALVKKAKED